MILPGSRLRIGSGAGTQKRVETAKIGVRSEPSGGLADFSPTLAAVFSPISPLGSLVPG